MARDLYPERSRSQQGLTANMRAIEALLDLLTDADGDVLVVLLAGRDGGQTIYGGTASGDDLRLISSSHATRGDVIVGDGSGTLRLLLDQVAAGNAQIDFNQNGILRIGASGQFQPQILVIGDAWATTPARQGEITFRYGPDGDVVLQVTDGVSVNTTVARLTSGQNFGFRGTSFGGGVGVWFLANAATVPSTNPSAGAILYAQSGVVRSRSSTGLTGQMLYRSSSAADPTTTELPASGDTGIHKNTASGAVFLAYNDGGAIKKVALT